MTDAESNCIMAYFLPARVTLGVMGFFMFVVSQMVRVNLYIALVPISEQHKVNGTYQNSEHWNENASGLLLSAFYWGYWATELPGGMLAQKYGGKKILWIGVTVSAILNLFLPWAVSSHYLIAAAIRAAQGLALGVTWPAMHWLSARWIPQTERGKFMTVYHGAAIGTAITYPLSGLVIDALGWEWVFYGTAVVCLVWSAFWWLLVYDSPSSHPRLRAAEKIFLDEHIGNKVTSTKGKFLKTPWKKILHSRPFWGVLMATQGLMWGTMTLAMQTPTYFRELHQLDIKTIGFFSGLPDVCKFIFSLGFSTIIDKSLKSKKISVTTARKTAMAVCELLPACFLLLLGVYASNNPHLALILLTLSNTSGGASSSGSYANIVDLSPNFAGTILGLIKTLTVIPGVVSPLIATHFTREGVNAAEGWRNVWTLTAFIHVLCCTSFQICGSGEIQPWNKVEEKTVSHSASRATLEMAPLNQTQLNEQSDGKT